MYRLAIRMADYGMVLNREAWSYVQIRYDQDASRFRYVTNGVEERFFQSRVYPPSVAPRLLYVGSWLDQRGIYYIAEALKILAERLPGVHLTVAGCHNQAAEVKKYFAASLHDRITVIPFVEAPRMPEIYAAHDIFLFPSLMEGLPLAVLEAMAGGMPVVTTESCGMPDVVTDDVNGLLVPPADTGAIIEAVMRLADSPELRQRLGQAAQRTVRSNTWDKIAARVEHLLVLAEQDGRAQ
jgi:glycosyltransferase involved in cell wall biosynthesis